jgi:nucleoside-diphosphate-sugar epimerase
MRLIITGSSGFVGSNFIKYNQDLNITEIDLLVQKVQNIDFSGFDAVLHLAALVHQMKGAPEDKYYKVNRDLTFEVAMKAKQQGVKQFLLMSTAKVYGESTTGKPAWDENSDCNPQNAYGKSKFEAEKILLSLQDENFKIAIVRSPLVYGVGVKANMYNLVKLVDKFPILPLGETNNNRSLVYVGNLVALLRHIINKQVSGIFIAGDKSPLSTTHLATCIAKALQKKPVLLTIPDFMRNLIKKIIPSIFERLWGSLVLENANTNRVLAFEPPYSTEQGISEMVEWYKANKKND